MKTPEEIKKGMEWCSGNACSDDCPYYHTAPECSANMCRDALAYIQQLEAQVPKWISAKERLPEKHKFVIVYYGKFRGVIMSAMAWDGENWYDGSFNGDNEWITHWMPLPEPPKENEDEEP